jgi:hypothetical protein
MHIKGLSIKMKICKSEKKNVDEFPPFIYGEKLLNYASILLQQGI